MAGNGSPVNRLIRFCLENRLAVSLLVLFVMIWGVMVAPFDWDIPLLPRSPIPVDAIPDIGENQQIIFTTWPGRSPQDVEDQITYPLTVSLLGIPDVRTIRSFSYFGYSSIYIIFKEEVDFYWSRSRILEKLSSLPPGTLPAGITPALGPDATPLGQIFWYTLEGRDPRGNPAGGWGLDELRSIQDWYVRYALQSAEGVSEVASVGGFVREYQIDVDPDAMRAYGVTLPQMITAVKRSNVDVGARTIEVNDAEYVIRGLGFIETLRDIEETAVAVYKNVPVQIKDVAHVGFGPALRRGALDKGGTEAVGGVVVLRYGENPLSTIENVKAKIREISAGLPQKTLADGTVSKVTVVPFYDRTGLIYETLGTLNVALVDEILVTVIVVVVMVMHLGSSFLIAGLLPLAILICFIFMKLFHVDANIVALSGIAIAIGTMVDMGIILCENILVHLKEAPAGENRLETVYRAASEVSGAILTAVATTIISFLPVFTMEAAEGKLFKPLAFTKTFALFAAVMVALIVIPPAAQVLFREWAIPKRLKRAFYVLMSVLGIFAGTRLFLAGTALFLFGIAGLFGDALAERLERSAPRLKRYRAYYFMALLLSVVVYFLAESWVPLGLEAGTLLNVLFAAVMIGAALFLFKVFERAYPRILRRCLAHKGLFLVIPVAVLALGVFSWSRMGEEFMPALDEGSYLLMPTTMPHASIGEALDYLKKLDMAVDAVPEIDSVVGKLGRADTAIDPAPISMFENVINYKSEYIVDKNGRPMEFRYDSAKAEFARDEDGNLIPEEGGRPFRQWRDHIRSPDDIWNEIVEVARIPGLTGAPKLQPIAARIVMLQSGMRAPMGVKVKGPTLESIEKVGFEIERLLKEVPSVEPSAVIADRIVGKPYLEIDISRDEIARYGLTIQDVQDVIEVAIGGKPLTRTVEGRERYPVRIRYMREFRDRIDTLGKTLIPARDGQQIPLAELAEIKFVRKAQVIKSEDTFLVGYVVFDKKKGYAEVDVVREAQAYLQSRIDSGEFSVPPGTSYTFAGSYENQVRSAKRLVLVVPVALFIIFMILYFQFRSSVTGLVVFSGIFVAWAGGFIMLWLYGQEWFLNFSLFDLNFRELMQVRQYNLSVAVWVGFIALFGIASDDGVVMATYIKQTIEKNRPKTREEIRSAVLEAGNRRIRPALMTTATTLLALLPVLTSTGRGSDIMVPMAIPSFGGMAFALITVFVVPVLTCAVEELKLGIRARSRGML